MIAFVIAVAIAAQAPAQGPTQVTIDSGMTRAQVVAKLGEPMSSRTYDGHTYLLYKNGCERSCGMSDLVVLDSDKVVDAIFRSSARRYSGTSSSPRMISMAEASRGSDEPEVIVADKAEKPAKAPKAAKATRVAKVAAPKLEAASKPAKVEKVEGGETAPAKPVAPKPAAQAAAQPAMQPAAQPAAQPSTQPATQPEPQAAPKLPQVFRPAPTPKKDTVKKGDTANKSPAIKKPTS